MTITIVVTKTKLAIAIVAMALLVPATAMAVDSWSDTPDGEFYHDAVTWAKGNGMTTGCNGGTGFCPDRTVTRGENITFAHRYDTLVVQPALATLTADVAALTAAQSFAVSAFESDTVAIDGTPTAYVTVTVTAPVAGHVTVNSTVRLTQGGGDGRDVACLLTESTDIPAFVGVVDESNQWHESDGLADDASLSATRTFTIAAGATIDYVLACEETADGGFVLGRNLTAIFTPAP